jgi:hypothetical protein
MRRVIGRFLVGGFNVSWNNPSYHPRVAFGAGPLPASPRLEASRLTDLAFFRPSACPVPVQQLPILFFPFSPAKPVGLSVLPGNPTKEDDEVTWFESRKENLDSQQVYAGISSYWVLASSRGLQTMTHPA